MSVATASSPPIRKGPLADRVVLVTGGTRGIGAANIGNAGDCRRVVREVIEQHGRLDILVNNAGITIDKTVHKMTDEDWHRVISINLPGAFFVAQAALEHMLEQGTGRIISGLDM